MQFVISCHHTPKGRVFTVDGEFCVEPAEILFDWKPFWPKVM